MLVPPHAPSRTVEELRGDSIEAHHEEIKVAQFSTVKPSELHVKSKLGSGAQADVYKAEWMRQFATGTSSIVVAVKRLNTDLDEIYRDREALTLLTEHPNLVKCFDCTLELPYLIVTEFCAGGSIFDLLYNSKQELCLRQKLKILADVASGMVFLHGSNPCIVHRDLKSGNVLLTKPIKSVDSLPFAKVADFGLSRPTGSPGGAAASFAAMTVGVGTWRWMAPEVFEVDDNCTYDEKADVFSFAMVMYEVLSRKLPYIEQFPIDSSDPRIGLHVCLGLRPNIESMTECPKVLMDLMVRSWDGTPENRPSFQELVKELDTLYKEAPLPDVSDAG